jgi:hypothetical protein
LFGSLVQQRKHLTHVQLHSMPQSQVEHHICDWPQRGVTPYAVA